MKCLKANTTVIKIGEKEYSLSFNFGVILRMQAKRKGLKVDEIFAGVEKQDFNIISDLLFYGIKWNHPEFKIEQIEELGLGDFEEVFSAIGRVFEASIPKAKEEAKVEEVPAGE